MKRFEQQRQYNPTTYQLPQGPLQAPDIASQIRAEYQRSKQADQPYFNQLQQNDKIETANMRISLDKVNQEVKRDTDFALQKLIPFSNKLFGLAETGVAALKKKEALKGQMDVLSLQDPSQFTGERLETYNQAMAQARLLGASAQESANIALKETQDYEVARLFSSNSPEYQLSMVQTMLGVEQNKFKSRLAEEVQRDDKFLTLPGADPVPYNQVKGSAATQALGFKIAAEEIERNGFEGINPMLMEQYYYGGKNGVRTQLEAWSAAKIKLDNYNDSQAADQRNKFMLQTQLQATRSMDLGDFWRKTGTVLKMSNGDTRPSTFTERWTNMTDTLVSFAESGLFSSYAEIDRVLAQNPDPDPRVQARMNESRPELRRKMMAGYTNYLKAKQQETTQRRLIEGQEFEGTVIGQMLAAGANADDDNVFNLQSREIAQTKYKQITGKNTRSFAIDNAWIQHTEGGKNLERSFAVGLDLAQRGQLTTSSLAQLNLVKHPQYEDLRQQALRGDQIKEQAKDFDYIKKRTLSRARAVAELGPDAVETGEEIMNVAEEMQRRATEKALEYFNDPNHPLFGNLKGAMQRAVDEVHDEAERNEGYGVGDVSGKTFSPGKTKNFPGFQLQRREGYKSEDIKNKRDQQKLDSDIKQFGNDYSTEGSFVSRARLAGWRVDPVTGGFDPLIKKLADLNPNVSTYELTNILRQREGLPALPMPLSMARFQEQAGPLNANFLQYVKDVDKAQTANQISRAGYTNRTGLQTWRAPDVAQQELGKVSTDSGVSLGALMSLAHMRNKNFTLDFAQLSNEVEVAAQQADTGGLTGLNRENYIMSALMGSAPNIVNGQLQLTDEQKINIRNLNKNRASFGDPAVLNYSANLRGSFQQYGSDVTPMSAQSIAPWAQSIAQLVGGAEVGNLGPEAMYPSTTLPGAQQMSIAEVANRATGAVGQYQNMPRFLVGRARKAGLDPNTAPYNVENQGKIFMVTLQEKGITPELIRSNPERALLKLSQIYAGIPKDRSGRSYYEGVGNNKATVSYDEAMRVLNAIAQQGMI
jgi:hypothetical protein